jgi:rhodanese-related sulfurtransferase
MLHRKLKSKSKVAVLDILEFEVETDAESPEAIPGALRVDPSRLRNSPHLTVPRDVEIVLYSSSGRDLVCARAAVGLHRIGVENVWVLEGGLNAWRKKGLPVAPAPELPEVVAGRLGVKLPAPGNSATR